MCYLTLLHPLAYSNAIMKHFEEVAVQHHRSSHTGKYKISAVLKTNPKLKVLAHQKSLLKPPVWLLVSGGFSNDFWHAEAFSFDTGFGASKVCGET
jgi:hypothetical protein